MKSSAKIHYLHPADDANATVRHLRENAPYEPMTHIEIAEQELADSKARGWRLMAMAALSISAFFMAWLIGYGLGYIVGGVAG